MIYIITFISSCVFLGLSEKSRSRYIKKLLVFIAILLPCILAGMRADTIGTDVKVYVEPLYNAAKQSTSFSSYMNQRWYVIWRYMYVSKFEIGFTTLVYLIVKFGGSLGTVLFFIHALIVAPIYFGLKRMDKKYPIWLGMLVFYLMFYNTSLNMMRQWIAMAILFWGLSYLLTNKKKKYFIVVIVACLFHTSALMGFAIYFLYVYSQRKREYVKIANFRWITCSSQSLYIWCYCSAFTKCNSCIVENIWISKICWLYTRKWIDLSYAKPNYTSFAHNYFANNQVEKNDGRG